VKALVEQEKRGKKFILYYLYINNIAKTKKTMSVFRLETLRIKSIIYLF
jgi:hypothetical protein